MSAVNPTGLCMCGCGRPAPLASRTNQSRGWVRGQHVKFIKGHNCRERPETPEEFAQRLWSRVDRSNADGCWEWTGARSDGYGNISVYNTDTRKCRAYRVHRKTYELTVGPIPEGMDLDHLCRNRACCNPAHLEPVTRRENVLRGIGPSAQAARRTECAAGHPWDEENTHWYRGTRVCRACLLIKRSRRREQPAVAR